MSTTDFVYGFEEADRDDRGLIAADDLSAQEYASLFVDDVGNVNSAALVADLAPRRRSERIRLVFDFDLWEYQATIADDPNPDVSVNCGRQVGKTETGGAIGADAAVFSCAPQGYDVMFAGDVRDTAMEMFRRCKQHFHRSPFSPEVFGIRKQNETYWEFENGARIFTSTMKNGGDSARGMLPRVIIVDEAALVPESAFNEVIDPMFATHGDEHELYVFSTPRGKQGYHYKANQVFEHFSAYSWPSTVSPKVREGYVEKKRQQLDSLTFDQEWLGQFVDTGNSYIPSDLYGGCVVDDEQIGIHPHEDRTYYMGVDVARKGRDKTVYLVMSDKGQVVWYDHEDQSTIPGIVRRMGRIVRKYDVHRVLIDENAVGGGVVDFGQEDEVLGRVVQPYTFSGPSKQALYQALKKSFEEETLAIPKDSDLERETTALQFDYTQNGLLRIKHPSGGHDDYPDALALANFARVDSERVTIEFGAPDSVGKVHWN